MFNALPAGHSDDSLTPMLFLFQHHRILKEEGLNIEHRPQDGECHYYMNADVKLIMIWLVDEMSMIISVCLTQGSMSALSEFQKKETSDFYVACKLLNSVQED